MWEVLFGEAFYQELHFLSAVCAALRKHAVVSVIDMS